MHNLGIWNVIVAVVLGGVYGVLAPMLLGRGVTVQTVYHYVPQLTEEPRRELSRALFSS